MKKYKLIESNKVSPSGMPLFQVVALRDFGSVKKGDKGGYIKSEANLSHYGDCWVFGDAWVFDDARVSDNARVSSDAWIFDNAWISDNARVFGNAQVYGDALVHGNAQVYEDARVFGNAAVVGNTWVYGNARVGGNVWFESGLAFATKNDHWDITEIDNGNGTSTLYADAVFEPAELKPCHGGQTGKFCSECGEKL